MSASPAPPPGPVLAAALAAAREGGEVLVRHWRQLPPGSIEEKKKNDFVTIADRESEERIVTAIRSRFPGDAFLGEEGGARAGDPAAAAGRGGPRTWIVDPLDGTANFIAGFPFWCVSIAAREAGRVVAGVIWDPLRDELYCAERGGGAWRNGTRLAVSKRPTIDGAFVATGFPFRSRGLIDPYLALFRAVFLRARGIRRAGSAALDLALVAAGVYDGFFELQLAPWDVAAGAILIEEAGGAVTDFSGGDAFWDRGNILAGPQGIVRDLVEIASTVLPEEKIAGS
ncbi:MAG TPA: inositol monophosphatase family protein [Thermoanaerobaculia bacterium]|nr:inositol monophosphatase family protein [Thermoanaerobaculia bacterium]